MHIAFSGVTVPWCFSLEVDTCHKIYRNDKQFSHSPAFWVNFLRHRVITCRSIFMNWDINFTGVEKNWSIPKPSDTTTII